MKITKKELKKLLKNINILNYYIEDKKLNEIVTDGEYIYFTETKGICNTKKCKAACCKCVGLSVHNDKFARNFADIKLKVIGNSYYVKKKCKNLDKNNRCKIHGKKSQSLACKIFPSVTDYLYLMNYDKCTKYIERIKKIKISSLITPTEK